MKDFAPEELLDLSQTEHAALFEGVAHIWEALPRIRPYLAEKLEPANHAEVLGSPVIGERVYIGEGTVVEPGAYIKGPAWIGRNCVVRHGAYVRENVIVGDGCVVGNSCEFKNSVLFNEAQVPHFSYVGDSILGYKAHLGAGVILSNLKLDHGPIKVRYEGSTWDTGLRKFGAMMGDRSEVGCNAVLNPGSILGREALVYAGTSWRGVLGERCVGKVRSEYQIIRRRQGERSGSKEKASLSREDIARERP